ncbi:MAG: hypothetical protein K9G24_07625 [Candidatus Nanopelagicales bacterium]|nr:hypothetical protein [Candidatus Nanopelagicales bacterium]MCF8537895.1 hypothetical protein [Candidatus Nanopelagicales bacterium]MCF8542932.1 hypothetical protein [Candidatus Nanopelagicales bacterium]MCF8557362.1 hypothetical protein [Candidatus Nanopelagicales bacterium]
MTIRRHRTLAAVSIAALLVLPLTASCGNTSEQLAESIAEQAVGGDVEVSDDSVSITDNEGNAVVVGEDVALPDSWPSDVPAFEGGTLSTAFIDASGAAYAVWATDSSAQDAADAYGALLEGAGMTMEQESVMDSLVVRDYTGNGWSANVSAGNIDGSTTISISAIPDE